MKLMEKILSKENLQMAIKKVKQNKGAPGIDNMTVDEVETWFEQYQEEVISKIMNKQYRPMPVKRVYIPKENGKQRPLGIPTAVDRVIQFLGFTFYKNGKEWKCIPTKYRKKRLYAKIKVILKRKQAVSRPLAITFTKVNQIVRGWINYFKIGSIKIFLDELDNGYAIR